MTPPLGAMAGAEALKRHPVLTAPRNAYSCDPVFVLT